MLRASLLTHLPQGSVVPPVAMLVESGTEPQRIENLAKIAWFDMSRHGRDILFDANSASLRVCLPKDPYHPH